MNWLLKITDGPLKGAEIALVAGTRVKVGRADACDIVIADATLAETAFELDTTERAVTILAPGADPVAMKPSEVRLFGTSGFAVGPADGDWAPLTYPAPEAEKTDDAAPEAEAEKPAENSAATEAAEKPAEAESAPAATESAPHRGLVRSCAGWIVLVLLLALLAFWFWPLWRAPLAARTDCSRVDGWHASARAAVLSLADCCASLFGSAAEAVSQAVCAGPNLREIAAEHGLTLSAREGSPVLSGNLARRTERLAIRALALASMPDTKFDLTDDESFAASMEAALFAVTEGAVCLEGATNRVAYVSGFAPDAASLERVIRTIERDVPALERLDASRVKVGGSAPAALRGNAFVKSAEETVRVVEVPVPVAVPVAPQPAPVAAPVETSPVFAPIAGILAVPYPCVVLKNGMRCAEGAEVGGAVIEKIEPDRILMRANGRIYEWRPE